MKITLTEEQNIKLSMFLRMTENYRKDEIAACESLSEELNENGDIRFPKMKNNAKWWKECNESIHEIQRKLDNY